MWGKIGWNQREKKNVEELENIKKKIKIALLGYFKSVELKGAKYFHLNGETWKGSDCTL